MSRNYLGLSFIICFVLILMVSVFGRKSPTGDRSGTITASRNATIENFDAQNHGASNGSIALVPGSGGSLPSQGATALAMHTPSSQNMTSATNSTAPAEAMEAPKCAKARFVPSSEVTRSQQYHELALGSDLQNRGKYCVMMGSQSLEYSVDKAKQILKVSTRVNPKSAEFQITACPASNPKCNLNCPKPKTDFWAKLGTSPNAQKAGVGFAGSDSQEERELQGELKALKVALEKDKVKQSTALWIVAESISFECR